MLKLTVVTLVLLTGVTQVSGRFFVYRPRNRRFFSATCTKKGWFGDQFCRYMCHCQGDAQCDKKTGHCPGQCAEGWFGPACQYVSSGFKITRYGYGYGEILSDANESSCAHVYTRNVTVNLETSTAISWVRVVGEFAAEWAEEMRCKIQGVPCPKQTVIEVDDKTVDIFCPSLQPVNTFVLQLGGFSSLCSIYISGGRNVALHQLTMQSSTLYSWISGNAVDGTVGTVDGKDSTLEQECSHTNEGSSAEGFWKLLFAHRYVFNKIVIYNRRNPNRIRCCEDRLKGFLLEAFTNRAERVFTYKDSHSTAQDIYTVVNNGSDTPVTTIKISKSRSSPFLTLCEVMVFGDTACRRGRFGRECERRCQCVDDQACMVSTGGCPAGCAPGFIGEDCHTPCPVGKYGPGCKKSCSFHCSGLPRKCNAKDGSCDHGCELGFQPPLCDQACSNGTYGQDCAKSCSEHCAGPNKSCDPVDGSCDHGCEAGYQTPQCDQGCIGATHGVDCKHTCSVYCAGLNHECNPMDGSCDHGCQVGYQPPRCETECANGTYGPACMKNCSGHCAGSDRGCSPFDGSCTKSCEHVCPHGTYGEDCNSTCSDHCRTPIDTNSSLCDPFDGSCTLGCDPGFQLPQCFTVILASTAKSNDGSSWTWIIVGACTVVGLIIIAVVVVKRYRRKTIGQGQRDSVLLSSIEE
ncbi:hypothetical protein EGW08_013570 [Elysia chlorotica]|uniref:Fucolectin tachylectin-4 pentraxin-1 domain-containing protein n=1 Tax=Elysia chlorotica TaxID=188477 RepID=A0A433TAR3_ELYCH|nr:hypothetical protein EGW08_013570 [Elysia chlorotica]